MGFKNLLLDVFLIPFFKNKKELIQKAKKASESEKMSCDNFIISLIVILLKSKDYSESDKQYIFKILKRKEKSKYPDYTEKIFEKLKKKKMNSSINSNYDQVVCFFNNKLINQAKFKKIDNLIKEYKKMYKEVKKPIGKFASLKLLLSNDYNNYLNNNHLIYFTIKEVELQETNDIKQSIAYYLAKTHEDEEWLNNIEKDIARKKNNKLKQKNKSSLDIFIEDSECNDIEKDSFEIFLKEENIFKGNFKLFFKYLDEIKGLENKQKRRLFINDFFDFIMAHKNDKYISFILINLKEIVNKDNGYHSDKIVSKWIKENDMEKIIKKTDNKNNILIFLEKIKKKKDSLNQNKKNHVAIQNSLNEIEDNILSNISLESFYSLRDTIEEKNIYLI